MSPVAREPLAPSTSGWATASTVPAARARFGALATPPGALGDIEELGIRLARIAGACPPPRLIDVGALIAVADHGVHAQAVSPWPQEVTASMVRTFLAGTATANVFSRTVGATVRVLDVGVATELDDHPTLARARVRPGTRDLSREPAMTPAGCAAAIQAGADTAGALIDGGVDLLITGDMGIANTTAAAALIAAFTGHDAGSVTGSLLAVPIVRAAATALHDVATLEEVLAAEPELGL